MDFKDIDELMDKMEEKGLTRLSIKKGDFEVELERQSMQVPMATPQPFHMTAPAAPHHPVAPAEESGRAAPVGEMISSPIVGTFYLAPSPDEPPFVKVGDMVEPESIVCIIEAMKVMNEVKAGVQGKVVEILAKNGDPVEYGTDIFRVE
ncbi:MAG: acetyl-CoA carboxylase biotin carboxyl carrier protein [Chlamydiales bacterium]|nr:acetyl-CoA carboxylase biotin carboxyl carrier protein [Chlamydiales bacterium]